MTGRRGRARPGRPAGRRINRLWLGALAIVALVGIGAAIALLGGTPGGASAAGSGPEGVPLEAGPALAPAGTTAAGGPVDGIACQATEQVLFHIHAHLEVFVDGAERGIPAGIGIVEPQVEQTPAGPFVAGGSCFYWLHTHAADGIIHIESPVQRTFTLGDFFDEWQQPLGADRVGPARGAVTAFVDGRRYTGDPRGIPLVAHAVVQLDVGSPAVPPHPVRFPSGL